MIGSRRADGGYLPDTGVGSSPQLPAAAASNATGALHPSGPAHSLVRGIPQIQDIHEPEPVLFVAMFLGPLCLLRVHITGLML